ncbi:tail protein [Shigella flexneri K-1770]|nr:tail protein [Shigella flexneri K-1770]
MRTIEAMQRQLLGLIGRAVVKSISAATKCLTVDVSLIAGEPKAGVEHLEPYGFTARANSGAEAVVLFFRMATVLMRWLYGVRPALPPERAADG